MIFTEKGFLSNPIIEQIFIYSILKDEAKEPDEYQRISEEIKVVSKNFEAKNIDIFIQARKINNLKNKEKEIKNKYKKIISNCDLKIKKLKRTLTWKIFNNLFLFADYIFSGYNHPRPIKLLFKIDEKSANLNFFNFNFFESKELQTACLDNKNIDFNFLKEIKMLKNTSIYNAYEDLQFKNIITREKRDSAFPRDYIENPSDLINHLCKNLSATTLIRAQGSSMAAAGIGDNAILVIDTSIKAQNNDIVVAQVDGEFVLRRLKTEPELSLVADPSPDHSYYMRYCPRTLADTFNIDLSNAEFDIHGVVTSSIKNFF